MTSGCVGRGDGGVSSEFRTRPSGRKNLCVDIVNTKQRVASNTRRPEGRRGDPKRRARRANDDNAPTTSGYARRPPTTRWVLSQRKSSSWAAATAMAASPEPSSPQRGRAAHRRRGSRVALRIFPLLSKDVSPLSRPVAPPRRSRTFFFQQTYVLRTRTSSTCPRFTPARTRLLVLTSLAHVSTLHVHDL